ARGFACTGTTKRTNACSVLGHFLGTYQTENPAAANRRRERRSGSREPSGVGGTKGYYEGSASQTHGRAQRFLTERPARYSPRAYAPGSASARGSLQRAR